METSHFRVTSSIKKATFGSRKLADTGQTSRYPIKHYSLTHGETNQLNYRGETRNYLATSFIQLVGKEQLLGAQRELSIHPTISIH